MFNVMTNLIIIHNNEQRKKPNKHNNLKHWSKVLNNIFLTKVLSDNLQFIFGYTNIIYTYIHIYIYIEYRL